MEKSLYISRKFGFPFTISKGVVNNAAETELKKSEFYIIEAPCGKCKNMCSIF
jgi:hypothetical protein